MSCVSEPAAPDGACHRNRRDHAVAQELRVERLESPPSVEEFDDARGEVVLRPHNREGLGLDGLDLEALGLDEADLADE